MRMRLDKWIVHSTDLSRQQAQKAVRAGRACINGNTITRADTAVQATDNVTLDGKPLAPPQPRYFMLYKPTGHVCANTDGEHPTVLDLLHREPQREQLQIAGRLDIDTTGLVLITDDGQWNHRVTAPARQCRKTYIARLQTALDDAAAAQLRTGVLLHGEKKATAAALLETGGDDGRTVTISICEGRYHQVKRMFAAVGHHVLSLHRESIGTIRLDPALCPGQYRALSSDEVAGI